jgi:hypothetical protein
MIAKLKACISQLKAEEREHFLRATLQPLAQILEGLIGLFTYGLVHPALDMKVVIIIAKKELNRIITKEEKERKKKNESRGLKV